MRHSIYLIAFKQSRVPAIDLVSDPPPQLSTPSRGAEPTQPSSESAASLMLDLLHGTVFHTISIISVTLVLSSAASKLNYFVDHTSLVVSAPGQSVNSAIEMTVLLLLLLLSLSSGNDNNNYTAFPKIFWQWELRSQENNSPLVIRF